MMPHTYICTHGHVDAQPSMGTFDSCQCLVDVPGTAGRGRAPCGQALVRVPHDPVLEAAYKVGGREAVLAAMADRLGGQAQGQPSASAPISR